MAWGKVMIAATLLSILGCAFAPPPASIAPPPTIHTEHSFRLPEPTGPYAVGRTSFVWADENRDEIASRIVPGGPAEKPRVEVASGPRAVEVHLWYPAEVPGKTAVTAPYNADIDAFVDLLTAPDLVAAQRSLRTTATEGAPTARRAGSLPVLLFSPGGGMFASDYTALAQDLASHGTLVVVVSHPGVTLMRRGSRAVSAEWDGWKPPPDMKMGLDRNSLEVSSEFFARRDRVLAADLSFVLDRLSKLDTARGSFLRGSIDLDRVAVAGHSTGGGAASMAAEFDRRIDALIVLDVLLPRTMFGAEIRTPLLLMRTDGKGYPPGWNDAMVAPFSALRNVGFDIVVRGARHQSFSDRPFQQPDRFGDHPSAARIAGIVSLYVRTFLDHTLRGMREGPPVGSNAPEGVVAEVHQPSGR